MSERTAPVTEPNPEPPDADDDRPALHLTKRGVVTLVAFLAASIAALYLLLPQLAGLDDTWKRIERGRPEWLISALFFTCGMFAGYVAMFRGIFAHASESGVRIGWRASYEITMAGFAASRLFAAGGAGGLVLMAWALGRAGMRKRTVADKTISFLVLTYFPYAVAVVVCGFGLHWGLFEGNDPFSLTMVPAIVARPADGDHARARRGPDRPPAPRRTGPLRQRPPAPAPRAGRPGARGDLRRDPRRDRAPALEGSRAAGRRRLLGVPDRRASGPPSTRSGTRRRSRCSCRASSSGCWATCCRSRAASAAWRAA